MFVHCITKFLCHIPPRRARPPRLIIFAVRGSCLFSYSEIVASISRFDSLSHFLFYFERYLTTACQRFFEQLWHILTRSVHETSCKVRATGQECVASKIQCVFWSAHIPLASAPTHWRVSIEHIHRISLDMIHWNSTTYSLPVCTNLW